MSTPPADATIIALSLPLFMIAGAISGTAFAMARAGSDLYYLVDDAAPGGPPVWIHEGLIEKSLVAPANVKRA